MAAREDLPIGWNTYQIDPRVIGTKKGRNPRSDFGDWAQFVGTVQAVGHVLEAIKVRRLDANRFELIHGERRLRAALQLKLPAIPVVLAGPDETEADWLIDNFVRNSGEPLKPMEEGELFRKLRDEEGLSIPDIVRRTGQSKDLVQNRLALVDGGTPELHKAVRNGSIPVTIAQKLAKRSRGDPKAQHALIAAAAAPGAGREAVKQVLGMGTNNVPALRAKHVDLLAGKLKQLHQIGGATFAAARDGLPGGRDVRTARLVGLIEGLLLAYRREGEDPETLLADLGVSIEPMNGGPS